MVSTQIKYRYDNRKVFEKTKEENEMLRIAVCDDIPVFTEKLAEYIEMWAGDRHLNVQK